MAREYCYKFQKIKPVILFIYEYRCYICGLQNSRNHVHHWNENPGDNGALNLIVLCSVHHKMIHGKIVISEMNYTPAQAHLLWLLDKFWEVVG